MDKSAKFVSEWKYNRQGSQDDGSGGSGGKATLGIQTQVDKPNAEDGNALSQENDNSAVKTTGSLSKSDNDIPISSMNEQEGSAVLGIKTMESSNGVSVENAVIGNNDKNQYYFQYQDISKYWGWKERHRSKLKRKKWGKEKRVHNTQIVSVSFINRLYF